LHVAQLFYCVLFTVTFLLTTIISAGFRPLNLFRRNFQTWTSFLSILLLLCLLTFFVHKFSIIHPFLLADNRHYTFYIWKNLFRRYEFFKFALVPLYCYSFWSLWNLLGQMQSKLWRVLYFFCVGCVLIPTPLVEFRYYITPFIFLALHIRIQSTKAIILELLAFSFINIVTIVIFSFNTFVAPDGSVGKFMW